MFFFKYIFIFLVIFTNSVLRLRKKECFFNYHMLKKQLKRFLLVYKIQARKIYFSTYICMIIFYSTSRKTKNYIYFSCSVVLKLSKKFFFLLIKMMLTNIISLNLILKNKNLNISVIL